MLLSALLLSRFSLFASCFSDWLLFSSVVLFVWVGFLFRLLFFLVSGCLSAFCLLAFCWADVVLLSTFFLFSFVVVVCLALLSLSPYITYII